MASETINRIDWPLPPPFMTGPYLPKDHFLSSLHVSNLIKITKFRSICQSCGQIHTFTSISLSYLVKFCEIIAKFNLNLANFDQIWQTEDWQQMVVFLVWLWQTAVTSERHLHMQTLATNQDDSRQDRSRDLWNTNPQVAYEATQGLTSLNLAHMLLTCSQWPKIKLTYPHLPSFTLSCTDLFFFYHVFSLTLV